MRLKSLFYLSLVFLTLFLQSKNLISQDLPSLQTNEIDNISFSTALLSGGITNHGSSEITATGFVWSTNELPSIETNIGLINTSMMNDSISAFIYGLSSGTFYYVRSFATNSYGTSYGQEQTFSTLTPTNCGIVTDVRDGTTYNTIMIGSQCWMAENLKFLPQVTGPNNLWNSTDERYAVQNYASSNNSVIEAVALSNYQNYGVLYNWTAAITACPEGWHLPAINEWNILTDYLENEYNATNENTIYSAGNLLKSCSQVNSPIGQTCSTQTHPRWNSDIQNFGFDGIGFSALPGGYRTSSGVFSPTGNLSTLWFNSEVDETSSTSLEISYASGKINSFTTYKSSGLSVRCLKNADITATPPIIETGSITNLHQIWADIDCTVSSDGGSIITIKGFVLSHTTNPSIEDNCIDIQCGYGNENFSTHIEGLIADTTYYIRAYAINNAGISYGDESIFNTPDYPNCGILTDSRDGKEYKTVMIDSHCWMAENLKYLPFVNGNTSEWVSTSPNYAVSGYISESPSVSDAMETESYIRNGVLYNWHAGTTACPNGWHLASRSDWDYLLQYLYNEYRIENEDILHGAGNALKSIYQINSPFVNNCNSGNMLFWEYDNENYGTNLIGFNALPNGIILTTSFWDNDSQESWWLSDTSLTNNQSATSAILRDYRGNIEFNSTDWAYKTYGYSVRCVRDIPLTATIPSVITNTAELVATNKIKVYGEVVFDGDAPITVKGFVYDTLPMPNFDNNIGKAVLSPGTGDFQLEVGGLNQSTKYYIRAYAANLIDTVLANQVEVTTAEFTNCGNIIDARDNQTYRTVLIGVHCWMAENLRYLPEVCGNTTQWNSSDSKFGVYNYLSVDNSVSDAKQTENFINYGVLYNWQAAQNACPEGWHLSTNQEWSALVDYFLDEYGLPNTYDQLSAGSALKSCRELGSQNCGCSATEQPRWDAYSYANRKGTDIVGFGVLPGGYRSISGSFNSIGQGANYWTSEANSTSTSVSRELSYFSSAVNMTTSDMKNGFSVRCVKNCDFSATSPTFENINQYSLTPTSARIESKLLTDGNSFIQTKGVVYSINPFPSLEINDGIILCGYGLEDFSAGLYGLEENTTYYVRSFATNEIGTSYSNEISFTTGNFPNCGTLTDYRDGNNYKTVVIGGQCWMAENLKYLPSVTGPNAEWNTTNLGYAVYGYNSTNNSTSEAILTENYQIFGVLYNWNSAQTACPEGWQLPDSTDWDYIINYLTYNYDITNSNTFDGAGNALKSCRQLNSPLACECNQTENPYWNEHSTHYGSNLLGFYAIPGGYRRSTGTFSNIIKIANFWTSHQISETNATEVKLSYSNGDIILQSSVKQIGSSIRCIKSADELSTIPNVTTNPITEITQTKAYASANILDDGGAFIEAFGLVYDTVSAPTTDTNLERIISFPFEVNFDTYLNHLSRNTTYFIRAFATNTNGTAYGNEIEFTTLEFLNCGLINDTRDSNTYKTVIIGSQCWMAENLRYLPQVNGSISSTNTTTPYYCIYDYNSSSNNIEDAIATENYQRFGVLYNYLAASPNSLFCEDSLINVQGVCPTGWHIPSDNDWKELEISLGMNEYSVNLFGWRGLTEGSALSGEHSLWTDGLLVSNVLFGESGFNAVPGGLRYNNNSAEINSTANYISSSKNEQNEYIKRSIYHNLNSINRYKSSSLGLISIRCLKNSDNTISLPYLTTKEAQIITNDSIISGGIISSDGGSEIISRGIVWSRNQNPDLNSNEGYAIIDGQTGYFISELTGLIQGETYYVRAYATNSLGTAYGNEIEFYTDICTPMYTNILITQPPADSEGFINICTNTELNMTDPVLFVAAGSYPESGYPLSDETVLFKWKIDNNFVAEGNGMTTFETTFTAGQGHEISLVIEDTAGCRSINDNTVKIRASLFGGFISDGCYANPTTIEQGQPVDICANHIIIEEWHSPVLPTIQTVSDTIHIDYIATECYTSNILVDQYPAGTTIENSGQLYSVGLNLVHSYLGDLTMFVQCPNGQEVQIGIQSGGGCNLGVPPMEAYWYEITNNASQTMQQASTSLSTLPAGQYLPYQSLDGLIGCPINGIWKLRICDNWSADEGYICGWYLDFDTLNTNPWQYEITYNAQWSGNFGANIINPDSICTLATYNTTETPLENSIQPFTFTISDNLGCSYDTTLFVTVLSNNPADLPIVETFGVSDIYSTKALCSGEVISEGNSPVSAKGIVFGTSENPTIYSCSGFSTESGGIGTFSSMINNLLPETEYNIRAYATNNFGTSYGENLILITNNIPTIICPPDKHFCYGTDTIIIFNESQPIGGFYTINGVELTEFNIQEITSEFVNIEYYYEFEPDSLISCSFNVFVDEPPLQIGVTRNPVNGIIPQSSSGNIVLTSTQIGDHYWITYINDTIDGPIFGNGGTQLSQPLLIEGCYTIHSSNLGCNRIQDVKCFTINNGVNKICVNTSLPGNEQFQNFGDVRIKLFQQYIDVNENIIIVQTDEKFPSPNNLAVFDSLENGAYYVESIIQNTDEYSQYQPVVFFQAATLSEDANFVTLNGNSIRLMSLIHNQSTVQYGNNTVSGFVGILNTEIFTGIGNKIVVLKNSSTEEILKITVTNQTGNYSFDTVPSNSEIEIFVSDFEYPNWTAYNVLTENNEDYVANFIMIADSVHPYNPVSNLTSGKNLNNFDIIPNPAKDQIKILTESEVTDIYIFDNNGKLIKRITENTNSEIEVNFLSPAVYYLTIVDKKGNIGVKKFVKQ